MRKVLVVNRNSLVTSDSTTSRSIQCRILEPLEFLKYYNKNTKEALRIINNAQEYVHQFKDKKKEKRISILVLDRYFSLSGQ